MSWLLSAESERLINEAMADLEYKRIQRLREMVLVTKYCGYCGGNSISGHDSSCDSMAAMLGEYPESEPARSFDELIVAGDVDRARALGVDL